SPPVHCPHNEQQYHRSNEGDDQAAEVKSREAEGAGQQQGQEKPSYERSGDAYDNITDKAQPRAPYHQPSQPPADPADNQPCQHHTHMSPTPFHLPRSPGLVKFSGVLYSGYTG